MSSGVRVQVGTKEGRRLAEISPNLNVVSWRRNGVSKMPIQLVRGDSRLKEANFRPGNLVYIEFDNGLPPWGGVIDPPSQWTLDHFKTTAYSGEQLLDFRQTDRGRYFEDQTASAMFRKALQEAESYSGNVVKIGAMEDGGYAFGAEYHFDSLLAIAESLVDLASVDFWVEPRIERRKICFYVHMKQWRGVVRPRVVLQEGLNIADITMEEQGPIINHWVTAGSGSGWGDDRIYSQDRDLDSINKYGLRQGTGIYSGVVYQSTLDIKTQALLEASKKPGKRWSIEVQNVKPALFSSYDVGDTVRLVAPSFGWNGFDGYISIEARYYDPTTRECVLVVEEDQTVQL